MAQEQEYDLEMKLFRDLIMAIWDGHRKPWFYPRGQSKDLYIELAKTFSSFTTDKELEDSLPTEQRLNVAFPPRRFLYLKPVSRGPIQPVLRLKCDFGRSIPEVRLRLGLFLRHAGVLKAIGYRYESPEGSGTKHHYYHVQMIRDLGMSAPFPPDECLKWVPDGTPTFPLDVDSPVKLVLGLLISLYGIQDTIMLMRSFGLLARANRYLVQLKSHSTPSIEWYWRVLTAGASKPDCYRTPMEPRAFRRDFAGSNIQAVSKGFYEALPKKKRRVHP